MDNLDACRNRYPSLFDEWAIDSFAINLSMVEVVEKVAWQKLLLALIGLEIGFDAQ